MQTQEQIAAEIAKLTPSQRNAMRRVCPCAIDQLSVHSFGATQTRVDVTANGFFYRVILGRRGAVVSREIM